MNICDSIKDKVSGLVRISRVLVGPDGKPLKVLDQSAILKNQITYDWGVAAAALFGNRQDGKSYHVGGMYLEFDNSGAAVDPTPTISRDTTPTYYRNLTGTQDFLRVPLLSRDSDISDVDDFSGDNMAIFHAQSTGSTGSRTTAPLTFSDGANSSVYGAALVAFCDDGDITQDLVISRIYFAAANQVEKLASSEIHVTWTLTFA